MAALEISALIHGSPPHLFPQCDVATWCYQQDVFKNIGHCTEVCRLQYPCCQVAKSCIKDVSTVASLCSAIVLPVPLYAT